MSICLKTRPPFLMLSLCSNVRAPCLFLCHCLDTRAPALTITVKWLISHIESHPLPFNLRYSLKQDLQLNLFLYGPFHFYVVVNRLDFQLSSFSLTSFDCFGSFCQVVLLVFGSPLLLVVTHDMRYKRLLWCCLWRLFRSCEEPRSSLAASLTLKDKEFLWLLNSLHWILHKNL